MTDQNTLIDLRATLPWLETLGLPSDDPVASAVAVGLCNPSSAPGSNPQEAIDCLYAVRHWVEAAASRVNAAAARMTPEQRREAQRALARAVASTVATLPSDVLRQAVGDVLGADA